MVTKFWPIARLRNVTLDVTAGSTPLPYRSTAFPAPLVRTSQRHPTRLVHAAAWPCYSRAWKATGFSKERVGDTPKPILLCQQRTMTACPPPPGRETRARRGYNDGRLLLSSPSRDGSFDPQPLWHVLAMRKIGAFSSPCHWSSCESLAAPRNHPSSSSKISELIL